VDIVHTLENEIVIYFRNYSCHRSILVSAVGLLERSCLKIVTADESWQEENSPKRSPIPATAHIISNRTIWPAELFGRSAPAIDTKLRRLLDSYVLHTMCIRQYQCSSARGYLPPPQSCLAVLPGKWILFTGKLPVNQKPVQICT
jgi:hypothetical protein